MLQTKVEVSEDLNPQETTEWLESLEEVIDEVGPDRAAFLLRQLNERASQYGVTAPLRLNTAYVNSIPKDEEVPYPGDRELERKIKNFARWNALAMVVKANKNDDNIGGHISTYASLATLVEVGQNHFFHGSYGNQPGACMLELFSKAASRKSTSKISATNCAIIPGSRRIRTRG
jgi:pyruvate dehydrogenase E1 component